MRVLNDVKSHVLYVTIFILHYTSKLIIGWLLDFILIGPKQYSYSSRNTHSTEVHPCQDRTQYTSVVTHFETGH